MSIRRKTVDVGLNTNPNILDLYDNEYAANDRERKCSYYLLLEQKHWMVILCSARVEYKVQEGYPR
jgi:hypothetical protein